jgi:hypothetical protein
LLPHPRGSTAPAAGTWAGGRRRAVREERSTVSLKRAGPGRRPPSSTDSCPHRQRGRQRSARGFPRSRPAAHAGHAPRQRTASPSVRPERQTAKCSADGAIGNLFAGHSLLTVGNGYLCGSMPGGTRGWRAEPAMSIPPCRTNLRSPTLVAARSGPRAVLITLSQSGPARRQGARAPPVDVMPGRMNLSQRDLAVHDDDAAARFQSMRG